MTPKRWTLIIFCLSFVVLLVVRTFLMYPRNTHKQNTLVTLVEDLKVFPTSMNIAKSRKNYGLSNIRRKEQTKYIRNHKKMFLLLVIVSSAPGNAAKRKAIRKTWKRQLKSINNDGHSKSHESEYFKFIVGEKFTKFSVF